MVRALGATGAAKFSRKEIDELTELVKNYGAKGLAYIVVKNLTQPSFSQGEGRYELQSPIIKFLGDELSQRIVKEVGAGAGDIIFFGAGDRLTVAESLAQLRHELGQRLNLIDPKVLALAFIVNFPLFEEVLENGHYAPSHHMFTSPQADQLELLSQDPFEVKSHQYDMIGNGYEL
ncbi:aspartate--tRNA ligase, partial [Candidatus Falkowbacteria bacterium CG_4_9_14_3_um_filter_38_19]